MYPRLRLDIDWCSLFYAAGQCLAPRNRAALQRRLEQAWSPAGDALACLSVRSGLDLLLSVLRFPPGSEIAMSAVNIRDMARIIEQHELCPVPVDIDPDTLKPSPEALERAITSKTVAVLVAHLFGSRGDLAPVLDIAANRGLMVLEDCAQAYAADGHRGDPRADVSLFSFGPIKTATALGGALLRFRDPRLLERVRRAQQHYPVQTRGWFLRRVAKFSVLKLFSGPLLYSLLTRGCRAIRVNPDTLVNRSVKGFAGANFFGRIRQQPSAPLLALLHRRLGAYDPKYVAARAAIGGRLQEGLDAAGVRTPGEEAEFHTHWVTPVCVHDPEGLITELRREGFDATMAASNMVAVETPRRRPECEPVQSQAMLADFVYLPAYPGIPAKELQRLVEVIGRWAKETPPPAEVQLAASADDLLQMAAALPDATPAAE